MKTENKTTEKKLQKNKGLLFVIAVLLLQMLDVRAGSNKTKGQNTFGIFLPAKKSCDCLKNAASINAINGLRIEIKNDTVFLYSNDLSGLQKTFTGSHDAIYLDLVVRSQFGCEQKENKTLAIYEGEMLEPVYFSTLFKNNRAYRNNLYAPMSCLPAKYKHRNYMVNFGISKSRMACDYRYSKYIPGQNIDMLYLFPKYIYDENLEVLTDTFTTKLTFRIPFDRSSFNIAETNKDDLIKKLKAYSPYLTSVKIKTFSSIEGSTLTNMKLQGQRTDEIARIIKKISGKEVEIKTESRENWIDFYKQIKNTPFSYLAGLSESQIKKKLENKSLLDSMNYLLYKNRTAEIEITIKGKVDNNSSPELVLGAYKYAVETNDTLKAYRAQNRLMNEIFKKNIARLEILNITLPKNKMFLKLWTNYLALAATDADSWYFYEARDTALKAVKIDTTYAPLQFNFCILSLRYLQMFNDTLIPISKLEYKMKKAYSSALNTSDSTLINHMWLNYSLLSLFNNWKAHSYDQLEKYLLMAKKFYPVSDISINEAVSLGLLFNRYGYYQWACELILPFIKRNHYDFGANYLFVMSYSTSYNLVTHDVWVKYIKRAKKIDTAFFYKWINEYDFQTLRLPEIREEFCSL